MTNIHRHDWKRIDFFRPLRCFECECGAAASDIDGVRHYSPRNKIDTWIVVKPRQQPAAIVDRRPREMECPRCRRKITVTPTGHGYGTAAYHRGRNGRRCAKVGLPMAMAG